MKRTLFAVALGTCCLGGVALADGTPKLQFDRTVYDVGSTSRVDSVSGTFTFTNVGDAVLKIERPQPSCGCTIAELKPDTLKPGESGSLSFTLSLGRSKAHLEKHITVKSNDPQTPQVLLTVKADYTPLYDINPMALALNIPLDVKETNQFATVARTDGKPLGQIRLEASKPWITAKLEPAAKADDSTARIRIDVQREGFPRRFNEYVHVYTLEQSNSPTASIYLYGLVMGDISLSQESFFWNVNDPAKFKAEPSEVMTTRRLTIRSAAGKTFELKNPQSSVAGIKLEVVPKEPGKVYELVAKLDKVPEQSVGGNLTVETSLATQPKLEIPINVSVFKP
jgi:uncharacterized protein DUF1573